MTDPNVIPLPDRQDVESAAAHWIMRLDDGDASPETVAAFRAWCAQSDAHKDAAARLADLWGGLDLLETLNDVAASDETVEALQQDKPAVPLPAFAAPSRRVMMGGLAASLLAVAGVLTFPALVGAGFAGAYDTAVGEQETASLPDGSQIILNTDSAMEVDFSRGARHIRLTRGEAYFDVASDPDRPFSVETEQGVVTAVGTAFSVRVREANIDVLVTEGRVALSATIAEAPAGEPPAAPAPLMEVTAGQGVAFAQTVERLEPLDPTVLARRLDWRDGVLAYNGEPLEQVIADISRYTPVRIEIEGDALRQQPIGGYFNIGETDALFDALTLMSDVQIERLSDTHVRLSRRQESQK